MKWTISKLAKKFDLQFKGQDREITACNTLENAGPNEISFLANPKYTYLLQSTQAGAVIVHPDHADLYPNSLLSQNPYRDFARIAQLFVKPIGDFEGLSEQAFIHPSAVVESEVTVYPFVYIGANSKVKSGSVVFSGTYIGENCSIGQECLISPNVSILSGTELGQKVILHSGVVIGSDGFGFAQDGNILEKVPQLGNVIIEDYVEIGANTTIDRATLGQTRICKGTKIDNQVQIAHNVKIGEHAILVAQVGIAGSSKIGNKVILAGQVGVGGHLTIGNNCRVSAKSGIHKSIKPDSDVSGYPATNHNHFLRIASIQTKLPELNSRIKQMEREIKELRAQLAQRGATNG